MKHMFIKSVMVSAAVMLAWNCSDDTASTSNAPVIEFTVNQNVWWLDVGGVSYLIYPADATGNQVVTDSWGNVVGTYSNGAKNIYDVNSNIIVTDVNTSSLPVIYPNRTVQYADGTFGVLDNPASAPSSAASVPTSSVATQLPTIVTSSNDAGTTPVATSANSSVSQEPTPTSAVPTSADNTNSVNSNPNTPNNDKVSSSSKQEEAKSSSSKKEDGGKIGNMTYKGNLEQDVANEGTIQEIVFSNVQKDPNGSRTWMLYFLDMKYDSGSKTYTISGKVSGDQKDRTLSETVNIDGNDVTITLNIGSAAKGNTNNNNNNDKKSSSSKKEEGQTSSSQQQQQSVDLKYVNGGASGEGWATRYWDCCKPSCAWNENAGGNPTKTCTLQGGQVGPGDGSVCSGGPAAVCMSQIPVAVNDNLAFAFAAVPAADGGKCGKCFALEFTGEGKYETKAPHQALKGKILVVMVSNIGGDVNHGQFDVMIPGGGVGAFNGCSSIWGNNLGAQYGGLLSDCEESVGYNGDLLKKRKECLTEKCNSVFANHKEAKEGCLFLANWMQAAGNPKHKYREVECPSALKAKW